MRMFHTGLFIRSWERFCKMFSESFPCLLGQHDSCSPTAWWTLRKQHTSTCTCINRFFRLVGLYDGSTPSDCVNNLCYVISCRKCGAWPDASPRTSGRSTSTWTAPTATTSTSENDTANDRSERTDILLALLLAAHFMEAVLFHTWFVLSPADFGVTTNKVSKSTVAIKCPRLSGLMLLSFNVRPAIS